MQHNPHPYKTARAAISASALTAICLALSACGGGDDAIAPSANVALPTVQSAPVTSALGTTTGPSLPAAITGVFLDAAVEGLDYTAGSSSKVATDDKGQFTCKTGETLTFTVGGYALGAAACAAILTPLSLVGTQNLSDVRVLNRLLALQLLDEDGDPSNGIKISSAVKTALASRTIDFSAAASSFDAAITATLALLPDAYKARANGLDGRRILAREHFEDTLASKTGAPVNDTTTQSTPLGSVTATITRYVVQAPDRFYVPYEGNNAATKANFPKGFLPSYGSGLAFKGKLSDGTLEFYGLSDRGPNGDGPKVPTVGGSGTQDAKYFPSPSFVPSYGIIAVGKDGAVLKSSTPIRVSSTLSTSGLSLASGSVGSSGEAPLLDAAKYDTTTLAVFNANGLDSEAIAVDTARGVLWVSDEYGPFILKIDPATGIILKKYQPGTGAADLPVVFAKRRANRGMEGLTLDLASGKLHGFLQSPLTDSLATSVYVAPAGSGCVDAGNNKRVERYARFTRWIEFDPTTETSKMYAYPLNCADYLDNRTGNAKLGDAVSLGNGKFIVIEQGSAPSGKVSNRLMLVEMGSATDISAVAFNPSTSDLEKSSMSGTAVNTVTYANVTPMKKSLLLDLNTANWLAEKAEGLTLVDDNTLALINDNDFGLKTRVYTNAGVEVSGADITNCTAAADGALIANSSLGCAAGNTARPSLGTDLERPTRLWLMRFDKKLKDYSIAP